MKTIHTAIFVVALILASITQAAETLTSNPDKAWKAYLENDTDLVPSYRFPHSRCFKTAAATHQLPETLLLAVARGESDFVPTARSKANAHGVMQILWPGTARHLGIFRLTDLYDPCINIDAGARYLKEMISRFDGNVHLALAAYNYGPERIARNRDNIPSGASWYSSYIFRHLSYVLGDRQSSPMQIEHLYSEIGRTTLVSFAEPYRAAAFVEGLEQRSPTLALDWFRKGVGDFLVVVSYKDRDDFRNTAKLLANAGFPLD